MLAARNVFHRGAVQEGVDWVIRPDLNSPQRYFLVPLNLHPELFLRTGDEVEAVIETYNTRERKVPPSQRPNWVVSGDRVPETLKPAAQCLTAEDFLLGEVVALKGVNKQKPTHISTRPFWPDTGGEDPSELLPVNGALGHFLRYIACPIAIGDRVAVQGVSASGKTTFLERLLESLLGWPSRVIVGAIGEHNLNISAFQAASPDSEVISAPAQTSPIQKKWAIEMVLRRAMTQAALGLPVLVILDSMTGLVDAKDMEEHNGIGSKSGATSQFSLDEVALLLGAAGVNRVPGGSITIVTTFVQRTRDDIPLLRKGVSLAWVLLTLSHDARNAKLEFPLELAPAQDPTTKAIHPTCIARSAGKLLGSEASRWLQLNDLLGKGDVKQRLERLSRLIELAEFRDRGEVDDDEVFGQFFGQPQPAAVSASAPPTATPTQLSDEQIADMAQKWKQDGKRRKR